MSWSDTYDSNKPLTMGHGKTDDSVLLHAKEWHVYKQ